MAYSDEEEIIIASGATHIENEAFKFCLEAKSVLIPDSVTSIGDDIFWHCFRLQKVLMNVINIGAYAFANCRALSDIKLPKRLVSIGKGAFKDCSNLTCVEIPDGVTKIEPETFNGCFNLTQIIIPKSVTNIGRCAFSEGSLLAEINYCGTREKWLLINKDKLWNQNIENLVVKCSDGNINYA